VPSGGREIATPPAQRPAARSDESRDQVEERRLAAAGRPEQGEKFAARYGKIDRRERARAVGIILVGAGDRDDRRAGSKRRRSGQDLHVPTMDSV
jgi:hypothetical protein